MINIMIGIAFILVPLAIFIWMVSHLSYAHRAKAKQKREQDVQYRLVLERAKLSERKERLAKANEGHVPTLLSLAKECELVNIRDAIHWYSIAADKHNEIAQRALIRLHREDIDDPCGTEKSEYWTAVVGARQGEPDQLYALGECYLHGKGVESDPEKALDNITQAAEKGSTVAQTYLGSHFTEFDPTRAFMWWSRAAINNHLQAQKQTALCYQTGQGTEVNRQKAIYWIERAAEQGDCEAQYLAAKLHNSGKANDAAVAYTWFSIAVANGYADARQERDEMVPLIGLETLLSVQAIAKTIFTKLKQTPYTPHCAIDLLNRVYRRETYSPSEEELEMLYLDDIDYLQEPTSAPKGDNLERLLSEFVEPNLTPSFEEKIY
ncbi:tetratricopeptide repeat protein [Thaumasiovibrio sp. DFM-14]|uniref:tetratricopeptide repeat protein n=1 Tax=Thaumasiovibrio sp. DFM-14 TaxID=3384792 RepID=UPI0039A1B910